MRADRRSIPGLRTVFPDIGHASVQKQTFRVRTPSIRTTGPVLNSVIGINIAAGVSKIRRGLRTKKGANPLLTTSSSNLGHRATNTAAADHYRRLLARHYSWTFGGDFDAKIEEQKLILVEAGLTPAGVAIDLGCGSGFQSIALAELGALHVFAIDLSQELLGELESRAADLPVTPLHGDLTQFRQLVAQPANNIVCMGDTLTHLASKDEVASLFADAGAALADRGLFILSWRDMCDLKEAVQFIPVRSSEERIFLCCLENRPDKILVHDLVYERQPGGWSFQQGAYPKLKISREWVKATLQSCGLTPEHERLVRGMTILAARRIPLPDAREPAQRGFHRNTG